MEAYQLLPHASHEFVTAQMLTPEVVVFHTNNRASVSRVLLHLLFNQ